MVAVCNHWFAFANATLTRKNDWHLLFQVWLRVFYYWVFKYWVLTGLTRNHDRLGLGCNFFIQNCYSWLQVWWIRESRYQHIYKTLMSLQHKKWPKINNEWIMLLNYNIESVKLAWSLGIQFGSCLVACAFPTQMRMVHRGL